MDSVASSSRAIFIVFLESLEIRGKRALYGEVMPSWQRCQFNAAECDDKRDAEQEVIAVSAIK